MQIIYVYGKWVKAFSPKSHMKGEWIQGVKVDFLDPDLGGARAILETVDHRLQIFTKHIALISKEVEVITFGELADKWVGTTEDYQIMDSKDKTELFIKIKCRKDFEEMFNNSWPSALATIKELSENT